MRGWYGGLVWGRVVWSMRLFVVQVLGGEVVDIHGLLPWQWGGMPVGRFGGTWLRRQIFVTYPERGIPGLSSVKARDMILFQSHRH